MSAHPLLAETGRCVACGLCLPHCPTYRKTQNEADSPRGRILLTQAVMQGVLPMNETYIQHMDLCLACRSCENVCPNQVPYGQVVDEARAMIVGLRPISFAQRMAGWMASRKIWWQFGSFVLQLLSALGLRRFFRSLPSVKRQYRWKKIYQAVESKGDVGLFLGCATSVADAETLAATIFVLKTLGYNVHIPSAQTCCGGLHRQSGDKASAEKLEQRNLAAFGVMPILTVASGCGARLIEFMPDRVVDVSEFLVKAPSWETIQIRPLDAKIAVHDACTLRNVLKAEKFPYDLLSKIPGAKVQALPGNAQCCGGAGSYMLTQEEMANRLRHDKINACQTAAPEYLATSNIGCALHLAKGLGEQVKVVHPVWILARQMGFDGQI